jgi:IS6 family transposase
MQVANCQLTSPNRVCAPYARLGPMRGLKQDRSARVVIAGHALVQNLRRGHYELAVEEPTNRRGAVPFDELVSAI